MGNDLRDHTNKKIPSESFRREAQRHDALLVQGMREGGHFHGVVEAQTTRLRETDVRQRAEKTGITFDILLADVRCPFQLRVF